ncbi:MAG TPA: AAA family ATPase [Myxococcaceae bacterium]|nr:AAA family ATPase [Myxococcaceae bacterium]
MYEVAEAEQGLQRLESLKVSGYRILRDFSAAPGNLAVIIGANASGKSTLFDFLRFLSFAASNPLPPEIDPRSAGKVLFSAGGPERMSFELVIDPGSGRPLRYEVEISGPLGAPRVTREALEHIDSPQPGEESVALLSFLSGKGVVRDKAGARQHRASWTVPNNELALRRALDPNLVTISRIQSFFSSWRFYSGFDVSSAAAVRRPVPTEPEPTLQENGANLSAVLFSLKSEHPEQWEELETHLRSAIPGFLSLNVKPKGGPGTVIGVWRERGFKEDLTLADLSDGTLRLLCWATLCLSPNLPPLICLDEPEVGFHPRVLPVLAGLLRMASARSQILVATHSPYFLSQFSLDEIAVMRKEEGRAVFLRPGSSAALRREIEELGSEALAQLHISDELEARS